MACSSAGAGTPHERAPGSGAGRQCACAGAAAARGWEGGAAHARAGADPEHPMDHGAPADPYICECWQAESRKVKSFICDSNY